MKFQDIKQFPNTHGHTHVPWAVLQEQLDRYAEIFDLDLDPKFQREHVWEEKQQIAYVEYILKDGQGGRDIYFNAHGYGTTFEGTMTLVDGKQRLNAVLRFLNNEIPAFGSLYQDYEDTISFKTSFSFNINKLSDRDVLEWYISLNSGIAHAKDEIDRVRQMIDVMDS